MRSERDPPFEEETALHQKWPFSLNIQKNTKTIEERLPNRNFWQYCHLSNFHVTWFPKVTLQTMHARKREINEM